MNSIELWYFVLYHQGQRRTRRLMLTANTGMAAKMRAMSYKNDRGDWAISHSHMMVRCKQSDTVEIIDIKELE